MITTAVSNLFINSLSAADLNSVQAELADLQRQIRSQHKANDLKGYGLTAMRILSTQTLIARIDTWRGTASGLLPQLNAIDLALGSAADSAETPRLTILSALGNDDRSGLAAALQIAFSAARTALNTRYAGQALFAGERIDRAPILVESVDELAAATNIDAIFDESARRRWSISARDR